MSKYRWTQEDDYVCCKEYLEFVFIEKIESNANTLIDRICKKLPHISRGSIRMKVQNIKQVALEGGLEDVIDITPLLNYSEQCKKAFDKAFWDFECIINDSDNMSE